MDAQEDDAGGLNRVLPFGEDGMHGDDRPRVRSRRGGHGSAAGFSIAFIRGAALTAMPPASPTRIRPPMHGNGRRRIIGWFRPPSKLVSH
jgi:hypothetical protein